MSKAWSSLGFTQESTRVPSLLAAQTVAPLTLMTLPNVVRPVSTSSAKLESLQASMHSGPSVGSGSAAFHSNSMP